MRGNAPKESSRAAHLAQAASRSYQKARPSEIFSTGRVVRGRIVAQHRARYISDDRGIASTAAKRMTISGKYSRCILDEGKCCIYVADCLAQAKCPAIPIFSRQRIAKRLISLGKGVQARGAIRKKCNQRRT